MCFWNTPFVDGFGESIADIWDTMVLVNDLRTQDFFSLAYEYCLTCLIDLCTCVIVYEKVYRNEPHRVVKVFCWFI